MRRRDLLPLILIAVFLIAGAALRWRERTNTYFNDEVWVLEFVRAGHFVPHAMHVPPLFFYACMAALRLCGAGEACMRMPAEIAALLLTAVPLLAWRTTRMIGTVAAIVWTALLAFCSPISFYAARLKQYPLEALACALLLWLFIRMIEERGRWLPFAVAGVLLTATMHTPIFVLAATGAASLLAARTNRERWTFIALHAAFLATFALAYFGYAKPGPSSSRRFGDLTEYFVKQIPAFWDGSPGFAVRQTRLWVGQALNVTPLFLPLVALAIGAYVLHLMMKRERDQGAVAVAAILPPVLALLASAGHFYPYGEVRLLVFLIPGLTLVFALAVQWLCAQRRLIAVPLGVVVAVWLALFVEREVRFSPYNATYMRTFDLARVYTYLQTHRAPDGILICREFDLPPLLLHVRIPETRVLKVPPGSDIAPRPPQTGELWTLVPLSLPFKVDTTAFVPAESFTDGGMRLQRYRALTTIVFASGGTRPIR